MSIDSIRLTVGVCRSDCQGAIMILAASLEFDRNHNPEVVERPSDNIEIPQVCVQCTCNHVILHYQIAGLIRLCSLVLVLANEELAKFAREEPRVAIVLSVQCQSKSAHTRPFVTHGFAGEHTCQRLCQKCAKLPALHFYNDGFVFCGLSRSQYDHQQVSVFDQRNGKHNCTNCWLYAHEGSTSAPFGHNGECHANVANDRPGHMGHKALSLAIATHPGKSSQTLCNQKGILSPSIMFIYTVLEINRPLSVWSGTYRLSSSLWLPRMPIAVPFSDTWPTNNMTTSCVFVRHIRTLRWKWSVACLTTKMSTRSPLAPLSRSLSRSSDTICAFYSTRKPTMRTSCWPKLRPIRTTMSSKMKAATTMERTSCVLLPNHRYNDRIYTQALHSRLRRI